MFFFLFFFTFLLQRRHLSYSKYLILTQTPFLIDCSKSVSFQNVLDENSRTSTSDLNYSHGNCVRAMIMKPVEVVSRLRLREHVKTGIETLIHVLGLNLIWIFFFFLPFFLTREQVLKQLNSFYNYERTDIILSAVDRTKVGHTPSEPASKTLRNEFNFYSNFLFKGKPRSNVRLWDRDGFVESLSRKYEWRGLEANRPKESNRVFAKKIPNTSLRIKRKKI